jgi:arabinofuranosyltransferase
MAHARRPPEGYVACFRPNVRPLAPGGPRIRPREQPLTAAEIRACQEVGRWFGGE